MTDQEVIRLLKFIRCEYSRLGSDAIQALTRAIQVMESLENKKDE